MNTVARRYLPFFVGAAGLLFLAGCADRHPADPGLPGASPPAAVSDDGTPSVPRLVRVRTRSSHGISLVARIADPAADLGDRRNFDVQRCVPTNVGECEAVFVLTTGSRYVFSAEPLRISDPQDHIVWANHRPVPVFVGDQPRFEPTVFVQSDAAMAAFGDGESRRKIDENLDLAYARALPLPDSGAATLIIELQAAQVRVNSCSGVPDGTYVFGGVLFDPPRWSNIPVAPNPNSPAIAQHVTRFDLSAPEPCELVSSRDRTVIVKGYHYLAGQGFSGSLDAFSLDPVNLTPDRQYVIQHYIPDPRHDGNPDGDYMTFGLLVGATDQLHWKVNTRGLVGAQQKTSTWEFEFRFRTSPAGPETPLRATVTCNRFGDGACELVQVLPQELAGMVIRDPGDPDEFGRIHPVTGIGYLQILLDVATVQSARLRARTLDNTSLHERPGDIIPDEGLTVEYLNIFDGYAHWLPGGDLQRGRSRSMYIPF
jgi:hypothetical protein